MSDDAPEYTDIRCTTSAYGSSTQMSPAPLRSGAVSDQHSNTDQQSSFRIR